jgi:hypothetical protein
MTLGSIVDYCLLLRCPLITFLSLLRGSSVDLGVEFLLLLHWVYVLVAGSGVAFRVVQDLPTSNRVLEALDLI